MISWMRKPDRPIDASIRLNHALRTWSVQPGAHREPLSFVPPAQPEAAPEPPPAPAPEPKPKPEQPVEDPPPAIPAEAHTTDYYEVLQLSRNADAETIQRVYHMMAMRFHPDNPRTGNVTMFLMLQQAYQVLSNLARRAQYDASLPSVESGPMPIFDLPDFVYGVEAEANRRLGVLSLLYNRRRSGEGRPGLSVLDLERRMSFPREHLSFTLWYLKAKGYVTVGDDTEHVLTALGVDFVEQNCGHSKLLRALLTSGSSGAMHGEFSPPPGSIEQPGTCSVVC
jgi:hypothetical protein